MKKLFELTQRENIDLKLYYIPSACNPAAAESRRLSLQDCEKSWRLVEEKFGPHMVDLMALDSNAMVGKSLRHFTPVPSLLSAGVNVFAQDISLEEAPYVFPPFCMISMLKYLIEQKPKYCTFVYHRISSNSILVAFDTTENLQSYCVRF